MTTKKRWQRGKNCAPQIVKYFNNKKERKEGLTAIVVLFLQRQSMRRYWRWSDDAAASSRTWRLYLKYGRKSKRAKKEEEEERESAASRCWPPVLNTYARTHREPEKSRYRDWKSCRSSSKNAQMECLPSPLASATRAKKKPSCFIPYHFDFFFCLYLLFIYDAGDQRQREVPFISRLSAHTRRLLSCRLLPCQNRARKEAIRGFFYQITVRAFHITFDYVKRIAETTNTARWK